MQATDEEVAAWFGITRKTLFNHKRRNKAFREVYERGKDRGKASLRRLMWQSAQGTPPEILYDNNGVPVWDSKGRVVMSSGIEPNITMQIFLAKNMLGMSDKGVADEDKPPDVEDLSDEELTAIIRDSSSKRTTAPTPGQG